MTKPNVKSKNNHLFGFDRSKNIAGQKFGRLLVIERAGVSKHRMALWKCVCDCGKITVVSTGTLTTGQTKSCGCLRIEKTSSHHLSRTLAYRVWGGMMARCYNPKSNRYESYNGRGIGVCHRWHELEAFVEDMGQPPSGHYSIERINNDGDYEPSNCKWGTSKEQARNRRSTLWIEYHGETKSLAEWTEELGINYKNTWKRITQRNWSVMRAFATNT
jgi:hypothetical protein